MWGELVEVALAQDEKLGEEVTEGSCEYDGVSEPRAEPESMGALGEATGAVPVDENEAEVEPGDEAETVLVKERAPL
jgi:hypothetical protein